MNRGVHSNRGVDGPALRIGDEQNSIQDRVGVLFFIGANGMMQNVQGVLTTFAGERAAVIREQENGFYSTGPVT